MATELLEIQPQELKFTFELKKQSSCSVQLINNSNHYVAFKVKTTAPKKYCVRPNTGIVLPRTTCDFTVTMQAQKIAPSDSQCKDKFLVQSTVVPFGTSEEDLSPNLFSKENGRFIEESKLRVVLVSPPHSPVLQPINGALKQEPASVGAVLKETPVSKGSPVSKEAPVMKDTPVSKESSVSKETSPKEVSGIENSSPKEVSGIENSSPKEVSGIENLHASKESSVSKETSPKVVSGFENLHPSHVAEDNNVENLTSNVYHLECKLKEDSKISGIQPLLYQVAKGNVKDLTAKINHLESKLEESERTISRLLDEKTFTIQERDKLQQEVVLLRRKCFARVQVGFPILFVCFVALVGMAVGYLARA